MAKWIPGFSMRRRWATSTRDLTYTAMHEIVVTLEATDLKALHALSNNNAMVESHKRFSTM
jgi:hypothetical protein